jgi:hypothetical protein
LICPFSCMMMTSSFPGTALAGGTNSVDNGNVVSILPDYKSMYTAQRKTIIVK